MRAGARSILIVDDDPNMRRRIREIVTECVTLTDLAILEASSAAECLTALGERASWGAVLLDISLPDSRGLDLLRAIRLADPTLRIIMLSALPADQYAAPALRTGAEAYLEKHRVLEDLLPLLRRVLGAPNGEAA